MCLGATGVFVHFYLTLDRELGKLLTVICEEPWAERERWKKAFIVLYFVAFLILSYA